MKTERGMGQLLFIYHTWGKKPQIFRADYTRALPRNARAHGVTPGDTSSSGWTWDHAFAGLEKVVLAQELDIPRVFQRYPIFSL
jgi:hypothetical protein